MIHIPKDSVEVAKARQSFLARMEPLLRKRINAYSKPGSKKFLNGILAILPDILVGEPDQLVTISDSVNLVIDTHQNNRRAVKKVFDYDWFIKKTAKRYNAYVLASSLNVNVCVYCNRNYTHTVITKNGEKITRPQFDHFFNKRSSPLLALSFYNLIPSCSICNSGIKHDASFKLPTHYHPYIDNYIKEFTFSYKFTEGDPSGLQILVNTGYIKAHRNLLDLKTVLIYNTHSSELKELLRMKYAFSDKYLNILKAGLLSGVKMSRKELYNIAFGVEEKDNDFGKRPFSKFKSDILKELELI